MICSYEIRVKGADHKGTDTPCQDACRIIKYKDEDLVIAAVADGVGSENRSDFGARIAVDASTYYCRQHISTLKTAYEIPQMIKKAFMVAQDEIAKEAKVQSHNVAQYHTTLSLAILHSDTLYYGHSGDSGIIALTTEGRFEKVTEQQRDEGGGVFTLYFEQKRVFGRFEKKVCSVLLATDGMLDLFIPKILENEPVKINTYAAGFFVRDWKSRIEKQGENTVISCIEHYVRNGAKEVSGDDLTVLGLMNTSVESTSQPDDYYKELDWAELKRKHMEENSTDESENNSESVLALPNDKPHGVSIDGEATAKPTEKSGIDTKNNIPDETEVESPKKKGLLEKLFGG